MKTPLLAFSAAFLGSGMVFALLMPVHAADPTSTDKDNTLVYRAETPNQVWNGWGGAAPPDANPQKAVPPAPEHLTVVDTMGKVPRLFSGTVVMDGPKDGVEVGLISLAGIHWNLTDAYQWEPVGPDGNFCITDKYHLDAPKALAVRGPNTTWTFLRYNFGPGQSGSNIMLKAGPSKKVRLTASGSDMVDLDRVGYEPFHAKTQFDDSGKPLRRQRFDYLKTGDAKFEDVMLPVGEIAIFVHRTGYADFYQIVDTTNANHIHFVLRKAGRMKITVLDAEGKPISGVKVSWVNPAAPLSLWETKTGDSGVLFPDHLVPGTFGLNVEDFPQSQVEVKENQVTELIFQEGKPLPVPVFTDVPAKPPETKPAGKSAPT